MVGEHRSFFANAIDIRRPMAHVAAVIDARVVPPDVVPHDDDDVWFRCV
jgi:hypothetical protein